MSARWPGQASILQLTPVLKGKAAIDKKKKNGYFTFKSSSSSNHIVHTTDGQEVWSPLPKIIQLLVFLSTLPALRHFSNTGRPTPTGRRVIAFSTPCSPSFSTGAPRGPAVPTSIHLSWKIRGRSERTCRGRFGAHCETACSVVLGGGDDQGLTTFGVITESSTMASGLCTLTRVVHTMAALTNFLQQYLKCVYHFTTVSKHFHVHSIIYLLLTRMKPGGQEVSHHFCLKGVESDTKWLDAMPSAIMAAKSHIQTVTVSYDWVQVLFITPRSLNKASKLLLLKQW